MNSIPLTRAALLLAPLGVLLAAEPPAHLGESPKRPNVPFRVLYSNDTTHTLTCISPYHRRGQPFGPDMINASVDETADTGVEVHMLQPGMGWVPWWKSQVYPLDAHVRFMKERFGASLPKGDYAAYMASGGDMVQTFTERCRERGLAPFISLRLNDAHGHEFVDAPKDKIPGWAWHVLSPTHVEHPEWRIGPDLRNWNQRALNWAIPEVPALKLRLIEEICRQYPVAGFELDFMRHSSFFRTEETPPEQRVAIMADFIRATRAILDQTAAPGTRRWLCVRIPASQSEHERLGIALPRWVAAGTDMINLSYSYFTAQDGDLAAIRQAAPGAAIYVEMCHTTQVGPTVGNGGYDDFSFRRTTPVQFYTTAHLAYARGLNGVSTFNFVYYREHGSGPRGPFCEPPFEIFKRLGDRDWIASQPQHYFLAKTWTSRAMPKRFKPGQTHRFVLDMSPPTAGWASNGRLRIQSEQPLGDSGWTCRLNGQPLAETPDRSEPYAAPYPSLLGGPEDHRAWIVPPAMPQDGSNQIEVTLERGSDATLVFLDLAMP